MPVISNTSKNTNISKRYNKKIKLNYDRLELLLMKHGDKLSTKSLVNTIVSGVVSIASFFATLISAEFEMDWIKTIMLIIAGMAALYFVGYSIWLIRNMMSIDEFLEILENDNELNKTNGTHS